MIFITSIQISMEQVTGIEPAIFSVTGRHVNRYTTGPRWRSKRDLNSRTRLPQSKSLAGIPLRPLEYCSKLGALIKYIIDKYLFAREKDIFFNISKNRYIKSHLGGGLTFFYYKYLNSFVVEVEFSYSDTA